MELLRIPRDPVEDNAVGGSILVDREERALLIRWENEDVPILTARQHPTALRSIATPREHRAEEQKEG